MTHIALIRGINVGGKNVVPMKELRFVVESLGHQDVRTYIQSGNVIFTSSGGDERTIASDLGDAITETCQLDVTVIVRTPAELRRATESNPFLAAGADTSALHVLFLTDPPDAEAVAALDPNRSPPDEFAVVNREVYLRCPNGIGRSKLTIDYFERRLSTAATGRNWKTVTKLLSMAEG